MTPQQEHDYSLLRDCGWEYSHTESDGSIFMDRWDRMLEAAFRLETAVLPKDGKWYRLPTLQANTMKSLVFAFSLLAAAVSNAQVSAAGAAQAALDPFARDYIARLDAAGSGPGPNTAPISHLVAGLRARGLWSAIKAACLLAGPDSLSGALVPLRADMPTPTAFNFVAGDYSRATGLKGNGASKHLAVGLYGDDLPQDDMHASVWVTSAHPPGTVGAYMSTGGSAGPSGAVIISRSAANPANGVVRANSVSASSITGVGGDVGMWGVSRASATSFVASIGNVDTSVSVSSAPPLHNEFTLYRYASEAGGWVDGRLAWYSAGLSIDLAALDTLLTTYVGSLQ